MMELLLFFIQITITFYSFVQLTAAAFGAAGQRCMALTTAVFVGEARSWLPELVEKVQKLKINAGQF